MGKITEKEKKDKGMGKMKNRKKIWKKLAVSVIVTFSFSCLLHTSKSYAEGNYSLTIMHVNDSHHNIAQFPKLTTAVTQTRAQYPNALLLHAGDVFSDNIYPDPYEGKEDLWFMDYLNFDAMTIGNWDFDQGTGILADFIKGTNFPVLNANLDMSQDTSLFPLYNDSFITSGTAGQITPGIVKTVNGEKIGIFGLLANPANTSKPYPTSLVYQPYLPIAQAAVDGFKQQGINKIICLSHLGYSSDQYLAVKVKGIDIIVGGHSHTVLSTPTVITNTDPTVIVQTGAFLKYMGLVNITFDSNGVVQSENGQLLTLNNYSPDPTAQAALDQMNKGIILAPGTIPTPTPVKTGWIVEDGYSYYYDANGVMLKGWQTIDGNKYYFGSDSGIMKTGWYTISGSRYYFGIDGIMRTGWQTINSKQYYLGTDGVMRTGAVTIDGVTYTFDSNGVLLYSSSQNGWVKVNGQTFYFVNGAKQTGWQTISGSKYYFGTDGVMRTGWQTIDGNTYYFGSTTGIMKTGTYTIDGVTYHFNADGVLIS
ncbi:metallophosphoesterase [Bacillus sp. AFS037270]|uniref:metallophosphoesterase n=1 Tax=Bacillus sp. AFS037270 TaxID=2033499 RepID=UPI000BFD5B9A|nr:metallophosphoesterase [Bacillus sp. AFS037270]PGV53414.1 hypothetical protein COD92_07435 [Bacillus sp. AFS037270]